MSETPRDPFERHLAREDVLSEAYRDTGAQQVPPHLRQAILASARATAAARAPRPAPWWRRLGSGWRLGAGVTAIAALAAGVSLLQLRQDAGPQVAAVTPAPAPAAPAAPAAASAPPTPPAPVQLAQAPAETFVRGAGDRPATAYDAPMPAGQQAPMPGIGDENARPECAWALSSTPDTQGATWENEVLRLDTRSCPQTAHFLLLRQINAAAPPAPATATGDVASRCALDLARFSGMPPASQRQEIIALRLRRCASAAATLAERYSSTYPPVR